MSSTTTPTTWATARKAQLDHLLDNILEAQGNDDHVIRLIAKAQGVASVSDFINISESNLQNMSLHDSNGDGVPIPGTITNKILNLSDFFIHYVDKCTHDWTAHNEFDLETFMLTSLTPTTPVFGPSVPQLHLPLTLLLYKPSQLLLVEQLHLLFPMHPRWLILLTLFSRIKGPVKPTNLFVK